MNFVKKIKDIIPRSLYTKFLSLIVFTIIGIFFELLGISLVIPVITVITKGSYDFGSGINEILENSLSKLDETEIFIIPLLILLFAYTMKSVYLLFLRFYNSKFSYYFVTKLSNDIYKNYLYQDILFHLNRNSTDLIRVITVEITFFYKNVISPFITIFMEILILSGIIFLLYSFEPKSTSYVLVIILFFSFLYYLTIAKKLKRWGQERILHEGKKIKNLAQGLQGIKTVKIFNQEQNFLENFNFSLSSSAKANQYATFVSQIPTILIETIAIFCIVLFMIYNVQSSTNIVEYFPKLALFAAATFRIMPSISRLIVNFQSLKFSISGVDKLHKEFPLKSKLSYLPSPDIKINFSKEVNICNLSFRYPNNNKNILQDINLTINNGDSIGIIGKTGEGKSTLVDLLCGLLQPHKGKILVDNEDIQKNIKSWQEKIGYVPQNTYLIDDTIRENIIFGKQIDKNTDENLVNSIKLAQLDKLISKLPEGLNTVVGDRGTRLSGGQVQRIGIARAIMSNAQVLVFDEATSALDIETERSLINDIYKLKYKRTLIIISHRISILENCDHIYNLQNGSIFLEKDKNK